MPQIRLVASKSITRGASSRSHGPTAVEPLLNNYLEAMHFSLSSLYLLTISPYASTPIIPRLDIDIETWNLELDMSFPNSIVQMSWILSDGIEA
jgi:hypothetical protein